MRYKDILAENAELEDMSRRSYDSDEFDRAELTDTRKPRLTLKMLNQLKKMRINKAKEMEKKNIVVKAMYGSPAEDEGGGP